MTVSQALVAEETLAAVPMARFRCLMDVGGGEGAFARAAGAAAAQLSLRPFDLPEVAMRATVRFAEQGFGARARAFGGDFIRDAFPAGRMRSRSCGPATTAPTRR